MLFLHRSSSSLIGYVSLAMVDMFNHGADNNVEIQYDTNGDCYAYAMRDIPAGSELRVHYSDPTDPTPLFVSASF